MSYTRKQLDEAVDTILPNVSSVRRNGIYVHLPSVLKEAAIAILIYGEEYDSTQKHASETIKEALRDLYVDGCMKPTDA